MVGGNIFRALRRYLSWIEGLTTNQNVTGSNPVRRTSRNEDPGRLSGPGFLYNVCVASVLGAHLPRTAYRFGFSNKVDLLSTLHALFSLVSGVARLFQNADRAVSPLHLYVNEWVSRQS